VDDREQRRAAKCHHLQQQRARRLLPDAAVNGVGVEPLNQMG
jgi:hypothetical protein